MTMAFFKSTLSVAALCIGMQVCAQKVMTDFDRVRQTYTNLTGLSTNMEYTVFRGHEGQQAVVVQSGSYKTDMKDSYLFKLGTVTQLRNANYDIMVSEEEKAITVETRDASKNMSLLGIDTAGGVWDKAVKVGEAEGIRTWRVKFADPSSEYSQMDITVDTKHWLIKSISMYYRVNMAQYLSSEDKQDNYLPKLTIQYKNVVLNPTFSENEFSEKKFIKISNGKILPAGIYQPFELIIRNP